MVGKFRMLITGAAVLFLTLTTGLFVNWWFVDSAIWLSSTSPNQKYTIQLTGNKGRGGFIVYSVVKYNLLKDGKYITKNQVAHYGDSMDISFELAYPEHAWVNENVARFWRNPDRPAANLDNLVISNHTDKRIRYLEIHTKDLFFVFDLQPHSDLQLQFSHQTSGNSIWTKGEFEDGSRIEYGVSFSDSNSDQPLGYCMGIEYDHITINEERIHETRFRPNSN